MVPLNGVRLATEDGIHALCQPFLHGRCPVAIDVGRCGNRGMAKCTAHGVEAFTSLERERRKCVSQVVEATTRQSEALECALQAESDVHLLERRAVVGREHEPGEGLTV
jgi:hypothetical protein